MFPRRRSSSLDHWWKYSVVLLLVTWGSLAIYIMTRGLTPSSPTTSVTTVQERCLQYSSNCDLRLHFLNELQEHRANLYHEHGVTKANPVRFLFLTSTHYYQRFMDRWWYLRYDATLRNPFVEAVLWGPGFDNYRHNETLRQNIARVYGAATYFHVINVFVWQKLYVSELNQISNETAVMELHDEAWCISGEDCTMRLSFIPDINASLVGFAYPSEMIKAEWQDLALKRHMFHIPKTVSAERFYKPPNPSEKTPASLVEAVTAYDKARDIDVLFISAMHQWVYPVRWKVACMYKSGYFDGLPYKFYHKGHPGYKERTTDEFNVTMADQQIEEYASLMRRSKIVITDSSQYHYAVGKYAEIPAAGALILGDIPDEREDDFNLFVARISHKMKPKEIVDTIKYWLENPVERYLRARRGQIITLQKYTNDHSVDLMVLAYLRFKQNRFGTHFAYPFADSCKATAPSLASRYCPEREVGNMDLTPEAGWFLPPNNCSLTLNEGPLLPPHPPQKP